jgi:hypothetical protein
MRPHNVKTPGCGGQALGETAVQRGSDGVKYAPHGATAINHAALMLDFARSAHSKFHASYFAAMAVKLLQPVMLSDIAASRARSLRLQSVGELSQGR